MPGFSVSVIREQFQHDTALMLRETLDHARTLAQGEPSAEGLAQSLSVMKRHAHSLRGLAGLVDATGLEAWGINLERLLAEVSAGKTVAERAPWLEFLIAAEPTWAAMNEQSGAEDHAAAWKTYQVLHQALPEIVRCPPLRGLTLPSGVPAPSTPPLRVKAENAPLPGVAAPATPVLRVKATPAGGVARLDQSDQSDPGPVLAPAPRTPPLLAKPVAPAASAPASPMVGPARVATPKLKTKAAAPQMQSADAELMSFFIEDAEDQIRTLERATLRWEQGEAPAEQRAAVRRAFHTLKGAANSVGLSELGLEFHHAEDYVETLGENKLKASPRFFAFLLSAVDQLRGLLQTLRAQNAPNWTHHWTRTLQELAQGTEETMPEWEAEAAPDPNELVAEEDVASQENTTIRVDSSRVAHLGSLLSEIVTDRRRVENRLDQVRSLTAAMRERTAVLNRTVTSFQQQFEFNLIGQNTASAAAGKMVPQAVVAAPSAGREGASAEFSELEFDRYDEASLLARSLAELASDFDQLLGEWSATLNAMEADAGQFKQTSRQVQNAVTNLSLVAFQELGPRLQRVFRDALAGQPKEARLEFIGAETLLDKGLVERVYPALLHLIRNAVAHGIEPGATRSARGKEPLGRVKVTCAQVANQIVIKVEDDGNGVDIERVRAQAIRQGLLAESAEPLRPAQVLRLLCHAGFSTAETVTGVAGRGVGMDVARAEIEALKGGLDLNYVPGIGTTWTIRLPLTLSITEGVIMASGPQQYALPINAVLGGIIVAPEDVQRAEGRSTVLYAGESVPLIDLAGLLGTPAEEAGYGLVISSLDQKAVLLVRALLGRAELPMKALDPVTACHPLFESASIDPQGGIVPVLSAAALIAHAHVDGRTRGRQSAARSAETVERPAVLVVDDSVSVRRVQERMLVGLGCEVTLANDGLHALECLREKSFHMILTDLEMPRLNGFELISEIRSHPAWAATPVIVISSRSANKYVTKAMNLGATSFLFKPFSEAQITQVLDHHVKRR
jgi:chemosensory pili system protein ChpA (sensor histidine kinase/response regulator)